MQITKEQITKWLHATQDGHHVTLSHAESVAVFESALRGLEATWRPISTAVPGAERIWLLSQCNGGSYLEIGWVRSDGQPMRGIHETSNVTHWQPLPSTEIP